MNHVTESREAQTTREAMQSLKAIANHDRRHAQLVWLLERAEYDDTMRLLFASLADEYPLIRQWSADILGERLNAEYTAHLRSLFVEHAARPDWMPEPTVRVLQAGALALKHAPGEETEALMARFSEHPDSDIRYQAMVTLFTIEAHETRLQPVVARVLEQERDLEVVVVAAQIAAARGWQACAETMWRRYGQARGEEKLQFALGLVELEEATQWLSQEHTERLTELFDLLEHYVQNEKTVVAAAAALARLAKACGWEARACAMLSKRLERWLLHPILKVDVAAQLALLGDAKGLSYLSNTLGSKRKDAKGHAIDLAGKLKFEALYGPIVRIAQDPDAYHNDMAIVALGNYNSEKAKSILSEISQTHKDQEIRQLAKRVLAHEGDGPVSFFEV